MRRRYVVREAVHIQKPYGCLGFLFDIVMTLLTGGLWLIWIFVREMRNR